MTITFEDVERKYNQARECIDFNIRALDESTNPSHATWLHHPTLASRLYDSSQEFLKDYEETAQKFKKIGLVVGHESLWIREFSGSLKELLERFENEYLRRFPERELELEALK